MGGIERCIDDEIPFEIPSSWSWCRFQTVISLQSGQDYEPSYYNSDGKGIPYITGASNIENGRIIINRWTDVPKCIAEKGTLLIVCKGAGVGKMAVLQEYQVHIARQIMGITSIKCSLNYLRIVLTYNLSFLRNNMQGVIPGISRDDILSILFPLPPLAEQDRIVKKVEELLPLIKMA